MIDFSDHRAAVHELSAQLADAEIQYCIAQAQHRHCNEVRLNKQGAELEQARAEYHAAKQREDEALSRVRGLKTQLASAVAKAGQAWLADPAADFPV